MPISGQHSSVARTAFNEVRGERDEVDWTPDWQMDSSWRAQFCSKLLWQIVPDGKSRRRKHSSDVPGAWGLGSSSSVIVADESGQQLGKPNLMTMKNCIATKIADIQIMWFVYAAVILLRSVDNKFRYRADSQSVIFSLYSKLWIVHSRQPWHFCPKLSYSCSS